MKQFIIAVLSTLGVEISGDVNFFDYMFLLVMHLSILEWSGILIGLYLIVRSRHHVKKITTIKKLKNFTVTPRKVIIIFGVVLIISLFISASYKYNEVIYSEIKKEKNRISESVQYLQEGAVRAIREESNYD